MFVLINACNLLPLCMKELSKPFFCVSFSFHQLLTQADDHVKLSSQKDDFISCVASILHAAVETTQSTKYGQYVAF